MAIVSAAIACKHKYLHVFYDASRRDFLRACIHVYMQAARDKVMQACMFACKLHEKRWYMGLELKKAHVQFRRTLVVCSPGNKRSNSPKSARRE